MLKSKKKISPAQAAETLVLKSDPEEITKVKLFLEKMNRKIKLDDVQFNKLLVATTEAVNNSIIHGNKHDISKKVTLKCLIKGRQLTVTITDEGKGINLSSLPDPLSQENILRENGRGVFLMRSLMDEVTFKVKARSASVTMKMKI